MASHLIRRARLRQEHDGLNIEFNWSLADDDVTPHGDAYRNLSWPKLEAFAKDQAAPAGKPFAVQEVDVDISFGEFTPVYEQVTQHLSTHAAIFTHDGAIGSFQHDIESANTSDDRHEQCRVA